MKKIKFPMVAFLTLAIVISMLPMTALGAPAGQISTDTIPAWKFAGGFEITSDYISDGVRATVPGADTVGTADAWTYRASIPNDTELSPAFSIANGNKVVIELSVKFFDTNGNLLTKSQNGYALDIYIKNAANPDQQLGMLRIWTDSGGATCGNHSCEVFGNGWNNQGAGYWIMGDATAESKFVIQFDQENFISSYVGGREGMVPLANESLLADRREVLKNVDAIRFEVGGDNGFTASTEVVLRAINGQSLASKDGMFTDTTPPAFLPASVNTALKVGTAYTIPTQAYDIFGDVQYSLRIDGKTLSGKTFTPTKTGKLDVVLVAADKAGNAAEISYQFQVVSEMKAPTITALPKISDQSVSCFETLVFDAPAYTDETGTATLSLKILHEGVQIAVLTSDHDGKFRYVVPRDFAGGAYTFIYEVKNSAGTAVSDPLTASLTLNTANSVEFAENLNDTMLAQYHEDGLLLRTTKGWQTFFLGTFDISDGMDVKFVVNPAVSGGVTNDTACVSWVLENADDPSYQVMYRVWIDHSGPDRATNVYISTDGGESYTDITDTGWISRTVGDVNGQYHMAFNTEDTFTGERTGGMTRVDNAYEQLAAFFDACPSARFRVGMNMGRLGDSGGNYEMFLTELNGQSFLGEIVWQDAHLSLKTEIPEKLLVGSALSIQAYAKDIRGDVSLSLRVTAPDGTVDDVPFADGTAQYTFPELGEYIISVQTVGTNGNTVEIANKVMVKTSIDPIEITLVGKYQETYAHGDTVTILPAVYSANVVTKQIEILTPSGEHVSVSAGDSYCFAVPGVYIIVYSAQDAAEPVVNEGTVAITVNVPDTEKPQVEVTLPEKVKVGDTVTPVITIADDSECDVTVTLTKPDGTSVKLSEAEKFAFTADIKGEYTLRVVVEDIYGNQEAVITTFTTANGSVIVLWVVIGAIVVLGAAAAVVILKKKNVLFPKMKQDDQQ